MNVLLDTNVILNDFFHRNPDFGFQRISDPEQIRQVEAYRESVHEALLFLSLQKETRIFCTTTMLSRFASLLGDLLVPAGQVAEELAYWLGNLKLLEVSSRDVEQALQQMQAAPTKVDFDDFLIKHLAQTHPIDLLVSSLPKSREFYWPMLVFKPEKIRDINWDGLGELSLHT